MTLQITHHMTAPRVDTASADVAHWSTSDDYWRTVASMANYTDTSDAGDELATIAAINETLPAREERAVASARAQGYTWAEIGELLGMSRQAAHKAFRHVDPVRSPR